MKVNHSNKFYPNILNAVFCVLLTCTIVLGMLFPVQVLAAPNDTDSDIPRVLQNTEPKLIVDSYEVVKGEKSKGEEFTLKVNIRNTNQYAAAYNVLSTYSSDTDNVRLIDEKTNQHYEEKIDAGEVVSYELEMEVLDNYEMDTMVMNFMFTYVDENGVGYTNSSQISPRIVKNCALEINSLSIAENAMVGAKALVNVRYSSTGSLPVKSAIMIIEGDILEGKQEFELEGVSDNEQKYFDYYVSFSNPGTQNVSISFKYTDENGQEYMVEPETFQVEVSPYEKNVTNVKQVDDRDLFAGENKRYIVAGCIGVVMILIIIGVIAILKKQEEKEVK